MATPGSDPLLVLALQRTGFLSADEREGLLRATGDAAGLRRLRLGDLERLVGRLLRARTWDPDRLLALAERDQGLLARLGASFRRRGEPGFPAALGEIPDPPFGVFLRGGDLPPDRPAVAVVGTRSPTGRGLAAAEALARDLALAGLPVVSGLARGIDSAAHRGALLAARRGGTGRGGTCAVLPCGIDGVYPASNRRLAGEILSSGGLLLSEYPPGTEPRLWHFPQRNRLISGLARALVVVEAPAGSGALITADFALEQGREVLVAAAPVGGPRDSGAEALAADGARLISSARELLEAWGLDTGPSSATRLPGASPVSEAADEGSRLAAALGAELALGSAAVGPAPRRGGLEVRSARRRPAPRRAAGAEAR